MNKKGQKHTPRNRRVIFALLAASTLAVITGTISFYAENVIFNNEFHLGVETAIFEEIFEPDNQWVPCAEVDKVATATNKSNSPRYVRMKLDEYWRLKNSSISDDDHATTDLALTWTDENDNTEHYAIINFQNEDDWELNADGWYYYKNQLNENETTSSLLKSVTLNCKANLVGSVIYSNDGQTGNSTPSPYADANYHLYVTFEMSARPFVFEQRTITIDPNGGSYDGSTDPTTVAVDLGSTFTLNEATLSGSSVDYWEVTSGNLGEFATDGKLNSNSFTVNEDITLKAHWVRAVAKIERTQKTYPSVMAAEAEAQTDDTITLLVDTEEIVTNSKKVTLNLNEHTITGSLTNTTSGNIILINGEINNPDGIAVTNNGVLTMGVDDYKDDGTANILNDNIRLIGTTAALMQTNDTYQFYFYDGYLEADLGLVGGYDGSPSYRNTFDGVVVHFYPFVDHMQLGDRIYQHVELSSADRAVSKTSVHGDIYYYNLQDNINTSIVTGYKIYVVRDFDASYTINSPAGTSATIDLVGYNVSINDTMTINGTLTFEDSHTTITSTTNPEGSYGSKLAPTVNDNIFVTPHDDITTTVTYAGLISVPQTIIVNGNLVLSNSRITGNSANDTIKINGTITGHNGAIGATTGYTLQPVAGAVYNLDSNSYIYSTSSKAAVYSSASVSISTPGNIYGKSYGLQVGSGITTIEDGNISGGSYGVYCNTRFADIVVNGGTIKAPSTAISCNATLNDGLVAAINTASGNATGIYLRDSSSITYGGYKATINGGTVLAISEKAAAYGINESASSPYYGMVYINGGKVTAKSMTNGAAYGIYGSSDSRIMEMTDGIVEADSASGTAYGIYSAYAAGGKVFTGGKIIGKTYGIYQTATNGTATLGTDDNNISATTPEVIGGSYAVYGGKIKFFDGILRSAGYAYQTDIFSAMPDATQVHVEESSNYKENCWLIAAENYLQVGDEEFNSLANAYNAITGNAGTIMVIADTTVEAVLPGSPAGKTITFDLNGHELTYKQPLINNESMIIIDSSENQTGKLYNPSTTLATITNNKTLTINSGHISSAKKTIESVNGGTININGGTLESSGTVINSKNTNINITGGLIKIASGYSGVGIQSTYGTITMTGGLIDIKGNYGISGSPTTIIDTGDNLAIKVEYSSTPYGIKSENQTTINSGTVSVSTTSYIAYGVHGRLTMNGGKLLVNSTSTSTTTSAKVYGVYTANATTTINDGEISVTTKNAPAYGIYANCERQNWYETYANIYGGKVSAVSSNLGVAYGVYVDSTAYYRNNYDRTFFNMTDGIIEGISSKSTGYGVYLLAKSANSTRTVTGGKIVGSTYGIYSNDTYRVTIGKLDSDVSTTNPEIIGTKTNAIYSTSGLYNFYDGVLRSNGAAYKEGIIASIPDSTELHTEEDENYTENCWLDIATNYLQVGEQQFNSLTDAYAAITGDSGTISVIADVQVKAQHPDSPANKTITFDLNGHSLIYTQPLINGGTMIITDSSDEKTGSIHSPSSDTSTILNKGTMTIDAGNFSSVNQALRNLGGTVNITDGSFTSNNIAIKNESSNGKTGVVNISGGTISAGSSESTTSYGISNTGTVNMTGGQITATGQSYSYGISGGTVTINTAPEHTAILINAPSGSAIGIREASLTLTNGIISVATSGIGTATGVSVSQATSEINGGKIIVTKTGALDNILYSYNSGAYGVSTGEYGTTVINGGEIIVTTSSVVSHVNGTYIAPAYGVSTGSKGYTTINGGTVTATTTTSGAAYGYYAKQDYKTLITGGTISSHSNEGSSYGINLEDAYSSSSVRTISGGTISGETYGIYMSGLVATIGNDDGNVSTTSPLFMSDNIAAYGVSMMNIYDGIFKGETDGCPNQNIAKIASGYTIYRGEITEEEPEKVYQVCYLTPEHDVAKIGDTKYKNLISAINAVGQGETIELIDDNIIANDITIAASKQFTIKTNGYSIYTGNTITNNGKVTIDNSQNQEQSLFHYNNSNSIPNPAGSELTLKNIALTTKAGIYNRGSLTLDSASIINTTSYNAAISNYDEGTVTANNNSTISGVRQAIINSCYQLVCRVTIDNSSITDGTITNANDAIMTISNSSLSRTGENIVSFIDNYGGGTLTINSSNITMTNRVLNITDSNPTTYVISNNGSTAVGYDSNISIANSTISYIKGDPDQATALNETSYTIYNQNAYSTITAENTSFISRAYESQYVSTGCTAIYNDAGAFTLTSGSVESYCKGSTTIVNKTGTITFGIPESTTSANYGGEHADVSITSPLISMNSINTATTYGTVINNDTGKVYFYDGKITTNGKTLINKDFTGVEYLYEPKEYSDENTGYKWVVLEWMRTQP